MKFRKSSDANRPRHSRQRQQPLPPRTRQRPPSRAPGSGRISSYHASRSDNATNLGRLAPQNAPARRPQKPWQRAVASHKLAALGLLLIVLFVIFELPLGTSPNVQAVTRRSDAPFLQASRVYQRAAHKLLSAKLANRNKITVNTSAVARKLERRFPELHQVSISIPFFGHQPTVYVTPAKAALILRAAGGTFVLGQDGRALIKASSSTNLQQFHVSTLSDQSGIHLKLGQRALAKSDMRFIAAVRGELAAQHIKISKLALSPSGGELDVYPSGTSYYVKFNLRSQAAHAARRQSGTYLAVAAHLAQNHHTPSRYIDVRVPGRAYYK